LEQLTSFTADFPVSPILFVGNGREKTTSDISGRSFRGWSESLNQIGLWVKTYLESCLLPRTTFVKIWSGKATPSGFFVMKLHLSAPRIAEHEFSLWRTPKADDPFHGPVSETGIVKRVAKKQSIRLQDQVKHPALFRTPDAGCAKGAQSPERRLLPTPKASDADHGGPNQRDSRGNLGLPAIAALYPTPTVHGDYNKKGSSARSGNGLATVVKLLPTPTVNGPEVLRSKTKNNAPLSQHTENGRYSNPLNVVAGGALNPAWVEWLMGFPIGWTIPGGKANPTYHGSQKESPTAFSG
jgi:hypothetical protein